MRYIKGVVWRLNDYFFDVDPEEPPDYVSAAIFYGSIGALLAVGALLTVATIIGG